MKHSNALKQLAINAVFWTGIAAIIITAVQADFYFAGFFIGLLVLNTVILFALEKLAPGVFKANQEINSDASELSFKIKPIKYPKVLDEEKREYLPEFIHLDITRNKQVIFGGDLARNVLKQLRDGLDQALMVQDANATVVGQKKVVKKMKGVKNSLS